MQTSQITDSMSRAIIKMDIAGDESLTPAHFKAAADELLDDVVDKQCRFKALSSEITNTV